MKKEEREKIYNKYNGHCAYCGKKIEYKEMQVDHIQPKFLADRGYISKEVIESEDNLAPACRRCNHYKRANSLETFRKYVSDIPKKLSNEYICKVGLDYGLVEFHPRRVEFFFEKWKENGQIARKPVIQQIGTDNNNDFSAEEYRCPTCDTILGYTGDTFASSLPERCNECGRLINWTI